MKTQAIVLTAGLGTRMKSKIPKPFIMVKGKPLFIYSLKVFDKCPQVDSVILVTSKSAVSKVKTLVKKFLIKKVVNVVVGGERRCDSVNNGLAAIDVDTDLVMVHDGARPFVSKEVVDRLVLACHWHPAAIAAVALKATVKRVDPNSMNVTQTLNRNELWEVQTPQIFRKDILVKAHKQDKSDNPTDDAVLVERLGVKVKVVQGDYRNIKVTTPEDLKIMEALSRPVSR